jgi:hypothetical protein
MDFGIQFDHIETLVAAVLCFFAVLFSGLAPSKEDLKRLQRELAANSARIARLEGIIKRAKEEMKERRAREAIEARYAPKTVSLRER